MAEKTPPDIMEKAIDLYKQGLKYKEISSIVNLHQSTIHSEIKKRGIKSNRTGKDRTLLPNEIEAIELYRQGIEILEICGIVKIPKTTLFRLLKNQGVNDRKTKRFYKIPDENFFRVIDTEDKGYFLGLLYADGHVRKGRLDTPETVQISLIEEDRGILDTFLECIGSDVPIIDFCRGSDGKPQVALNLTNRTICRDLWNQGLEPWRKQNNIGPDIINMPRDVQRGFLRGIFDGDGWVHLDRGKYARVTFMGSKNLCEQINEIICSLGIQKSAVRPGKDANQPHTVGYGKSNYAFKIFNYFYANPTSPFITRKKNRFIEVLNICK